MRSRSSNRAFIDSVKAAICASVDVIRISHPGERLAGFALLTDDGLSTLLHRAVTMEALGAATDPDLLFTQTDWPYEDGADAFNAPDAKLREQATNAASFEAHVDGAFSGLERALEESRSDGVFDSGVFLSVTSTDPGEYLRTLSEEAISRLNSPDLVQARRRFLDKWQ